RDIVLAHLNGHYKGDASGETFRGSGRTDLRIEAESRAAFVAECKVWKGSQIIQESVDQLLGYLTWRDCKAALVIFNKNVAGFSKASRLMSDVDQVLPPEPQGEETTFHRCLKALHLTVALASQAHTTWLTVGYFITRNDNRFPITGYLVRSSFLTMIIELYK